ncbi:MAG: hypothetical protein Q4B28_02715 [bacterium]|nr:hypothetical protein [bacterium]
MFESIENTISILSFLNGLKEKLFREIGPLKKSLHDDIEQYFLDCFLKLREFQFMNIEKIDQDTKKWVELLAHEEQFFLEKSDLSIKDMYDFSSKTTVLSTGFENFLKQNKKEAELVEQLKTKLKAFSEVLHSQIKNYVDEEKVVNISSLEKEKNVLMVFIKQHFQEFKVLYISFMFSML